MVGSMDGSMDGSLDGSLDDSMDGSMDGSLDGSLDSLGMLLLLGIREIEIDGDSLGTMHCSPSA